MKSLTFYHVTDTHTSDPEKYGITAINRAAVLDKVFDSIIADAGTEVVIISGDEADHGLYTEHDIFRKQARRLLDAGKKVYLITATHDFHLTKVFPDGTSEPREGVANRSELRDMYEDFGYSSAISEFDRMSYVVKPCDGFRILMLNDDGDGTKFRGYSEAQKEWIAVQTKEAHDCGDYIFAVNHHPVIPPTPAYAMIAETSMVGDYRNTGKFFADNGIRFVFTGHTHMHSIRSITSDRGNVLYDINTGTISDFPLVYRKVTVYDTGEADIKTMPIGEVPFDTEGKEVRQYYTDLFENRILNAIDGMENDFDRFAGEIGSLAINVEPLRSKQKLVAVGGKILNNITIGGVCRLIGCPVKNISPIDKRKFKYLLADIVKNVYAGDEPFSPETPEYKVISAIISRVEPLLRKKLAGTKFEDLKGFVESLIYDPDPDANAHIGF